MSSKQETVSFRCVDFTVSTFKEDDFIITIYGIDENRKTYCVKVNDFKPFFYIKVGHSWNDCDVTEYFDHIRKTNKDNYSLLKCLNNDIEEVKLIKHKTLYNFDANKKHNFVRVTCANMSLVYKFKSLFYDKEKQKLNEGVKFKDTYTQLYEIMIPPMLRFFHIQDISPSGWIEIENYDIVDEESMETTVNLEITSSFKDIISLPEKELVVPYKICSFDIEASSSHGDFPNAIKNYKKVAYDVLDYTQLNKDEVEEQGIQLLLYFLLKSVFGFANDIMIDICYPKNKTYTELKFEKDFIKFIESNVSLNDEDLVESSVNTLDSYMNVFEGGDEVNNTGNVEIDISEEDDIENKVVKKQQKSKKKTISKDCITIISIIEDNNYDNQTKMGYLTSALNKAFPPLEGDYVTFIGSTFVTYGEEESNLNHCICLNETTNLDETTQVIESYDNEKDVLLAWTNVIQREDPDIIIGYNIFGFDYPFMFDRARENNCEDEFMNLSRKKETYGEDEDIKLSQTKIVLASGAYDLKYPLMQGRLQIDVFTYMRKEFILPSYKLDFVSSYLISDKVTSFENDNIKNCCEIQTKNIKGITLNCFVHFEINNHSSESYNNGEKFKVIEVTDYGFMIEGILDNILKKENIQWGLAKDDVTPQDIFRMTNEGPNEKGVIAKYCIQDCNLVHQIFQKVDIMTTYIEMSKICSVPISFLMLRGQGIKLTSYIAKKCRAKDTLMPLISVGNVSDLYEGAIVLEPKSGLYLDNPVACVDYSSLYPSSIISENISHDSKVWTKEYELDGNIAFDRQGNKKVSGIVDKNGNFKYDNLPGYKYVDIKYDTFSFKRLGGFSSKPTKVLTGYKICRYAQFPDNERAILPSILQELLHARKATKKQMAKETDPFMKNIYDKRQASIKVTANSLYGQCGAKTSTFYEMDIAASTTATGRKLLIYAKDMIEKVYDNIDIKTKHGVMRANAEYIYGDTDSVFFTFNLKDPKTNKDVRGKKALEVTIELAKQAGQLATCHLKAPHDLEYEKTFMPFCLISKKRYVGLLYEEDPNKCKRKSMGIVLKRRDNAPIVKDIYGGIIDILMKEQNIEKSIEFLDNMLKKIVNEEIDMEKLVISKSLRSFYKCPQQIAHKVLADRIGVRDPGNKPRAGDRIPYVYIYSKNKKELQGKRIEHPDYITLQKLKIDYGFYITNQIMKPVAQIYSLVLFDIASFKRKSTSFKNKINTLMQNSDDEAKTLRKIQTLKDKEVETLLFKKYITINNNKAQSNQMITDFFK
jgi:DNA polymerase elongation subunit (family B)